MVGACSEEQDAPSLPKPVVLAVLRDGVPDTSVRAVFVDAAGTLVQQGLVGTGGLASAELPEGGMVHVLSVTEPDPATRNVTIRSVRGVKPGDSLRFNEARRRWRPEDGTDEVVEGLFTPLPDSFSYRFDVPCGTAARTSLDAITADLNRACTQASVPLFVFATDPQTPQPKYTSTTVSRATDGRLYFNVPAFQDMPTMSLQLNNPGLEYYLDVQVSALLGAHLNHWTASHTTRVLARRGVSTVDLYHVPGLRHMIMVGSYRDAVVTVTDGVKPATLSYPALLVPSVSTEASLSGKVVSWNQSGTATPDLRVVKATTRFRSNGRTTTVTWVVYSGSRSNTEELPGLPAMFSEIDPTVQLVTEPISASVAYVNYSNIDDYDDARNGPFESMADLLETPGASSGQYQAQLSRSP